MAESPAFPRSAPTAADGERREAERLTVLSKRLVSVRMREVRMSREKSQ
jgi:hypothetical protein